jgi:hypothetical protein
MPLGIRDSKEFWNILQRGVRMVIVIVFLAAFRNVLFPAMADVCLNVL